MGSLTPRVQEWRAQGQMLTVRGRRLFVRRREGSDPLVVFLHGFPSSSYDWRATLSLLGDRRVLAFDFLGFGFSEKPRGEAYSMLLQADLVEELVGEEAGTPVVVAHDMGTSVPTELLARALDGSLSFTLAGTLLFNGSMIIERASLTWAQKALRSPAGGLLALLSNRQVFVRQFARLFSPEHPRSADEAVDQWALWRHDGGAGSPTALSGTLGSARRTRGGGTAPSVTGRERCGSRGGCSTPWPRLAC